MVVNRCAKRGNRLTHHLLPKASRLMAKKASKLSYLPQCPRLALVFAENLAEAQNAVAALTPSAAPTARHDAPCALQQNGHHVEGCLAVYGARLVPLTLVSSSTIYLVSC
jgi:hypothetical protein